MTSGSLTGHGGGEAGGTSARINMVYFGNQRDQECSTEGGIAIAHARDNMAKHYKVERGYDGECRRGEKAKQAERGSLRCEVKRNVQSTNLGGGEAGPSVGNASVGGAFHGRNSVGGAFHGRNSVGGAFRGRNSVGGAFHGRNSVGGAFHGRNSVGGAHLQHFLGIHLAPSGQRRRAQGIPDVGC